MNRSIHFIKIVKVQMSDFHLIDKMKKIQQNVLDFIDNNDDIEENYENLIKSLNNQKVEKDSHIFKLFILMISKIAENHYRNLNFFNKIELILSYYYNDLKKYFSNDEIFDFFRHSKLILLYLFENSFIQINPKICSLMMQKKYKDFKYPEFFYPEIQKMVDFKMESIPDNFDEKRRKGENDDILCEIIRNDQIDEFIEYVSKNNIPLDSKIKDSIFETNYILLENKPTILYYASFFGSIKILEYLISNIEDFYGDNPIYECLIHHNNPKIISLLDEKYSFGYFDSVFFLFLYFESIKCHNNELGDFISKKFFDEDEEDIEQTDYFQRNKYVAAFKFHNYFFFPKDISHNIFFFYACRYDYFNIVEYFIKTKEIDLNMKIIQNFIVK